MLEEEEEEMMYTLDPHISNYRLRILKQEQEIRALRKERDETSRCNFCKQRKLRKQLEKAVEALRKAKEKEHLKITLKRALSLESDEEDLDKLRKDIQQEKKMLKRSPRSELKRNIASKEKKLQLMESEIRKLKTKLTIIDVGERTYYRNLSKKSSTSSYSS